MAGNAATGPADADIKGTRLDPVTSLYTQDYLLAEISRSLKRVRQAELQVSLALLQLENFYEIRSWVGKSEADLLLCHIARRLESCLPPSVLLCRCEHYEFALLLFNESSSGCRLITDRVRAALQSTHSEFIPPQLELKCAVGLSSLEANMPSAEVVLARARHDLRLPQRQLHDSSLVDPEHALPSLRQALQEQNLRLSYQPLISFQPAQPAHYEVRCGLADGSLPASILFESAVQNALGEALDRWVISRVLAEAQEVRLTVNLTLNSLVSAEFFPWLQRQLQAHNSTAGQLQFQISEIDLLIAQHHLGHVCEQLRQLQIGLCIQHFGCSDDPFRYLPLLKAEAVKLDVSLLEKIYVDPEKQDGLRKILHKLHSRGLQVIAGQLEELRLLPLLWQAGIDQVQGNCLQAGRASMDYQFPSVQRLSLD